MFRLNIPTFKRPFLIIGVPPNEGILLLTANLKAKRFRHGLKFNPKLDDLGIISRRVVTTAGVNYMRDDFAAAAGAADITNFKYHASGTGTVAEAIGDTALGTEVEATRSTGTQVAYATKQYQSVAAIAYTTNRAITEHGLFSAATTGTLWDRSVFTAINVVNLDSIQFTYTLSISDNG